MSTTIRRPRFALIFDGTSLEVWHVVCLERLEACADLTAVVVLPLSDPPRRVAASRALQRYAAHVARGARRSIPTRIAGLPRLTAADLGGDRFDFFLKLGPGPVPSLHARAAIWYFSHETVQDLTPFLREVVEGRDVTLTALLRTGAAPRTVDVLEEGAFRTTRRSYRDHRRRVEHAIAEWPARVCARGARPLRALSSGGDGAAPPPRTRGTLTALGLRLLSRKLDFARQRLFSHTQWNIGVVTGRIEQFLRPDPDRDRRIVWFPLAKSAGFLADPFGRFADGVLEVFYEVFDYSAGRGRIASMTFDGQAFSSERPAITLGSHMSYPFVFEHEGRTFCVPETSSEGEVLLFERTSESWTRRLTLLSVPGVDSTLWEHDGRWWLFCTLRGSLADEELWIWHAPSLTGDWTPHTRNPVKTDVRGARPGGTPFVYEGVLYRPAQDCSRTYGGRMVIQAVRCLTPDEFLEEPVATVEASPDSAFPLGRHTLSAAGDWVLIDGHRSRFSLAAFAIVTRAWATALGRRLVGR